MKQDVECYSGRKANERPVRFRLEAREYAVEAVLDQWYDPESILLRFAPMTGIFIFFANKLRRPVERGTWSHFANRRALELSRMQWANAGRRAMLAWRKTQGSECR